VTESLYLNGIRGTLWRDPDTGTYVVTIQGHETRIEARTYQQAIEWWEATATTLAGQ